MKVDIWSDIRCPFCYIGKKNFENGLKNFHHADKIQVIWHSFQLDPNVETDPEKDVLEYFTQAKGISKDQAVEMFNHVANAAQQAGLQFNMHSQILANSFRGHLLIQLAQKNGLGNQAEEALFKAYFTDGKNIDDIQTLTAIGESISLNTKDIHEALNSDDFGLMVKQDMQMARQMGINSVPFFIFNDKYAVSGAQPASVFTEVLEKSWEEFSAGDSGLKIINQGESCDIDGNCD